MKYILSFYLILQTSYFFAAQPSQAQKLGEGSFGNIYVDPYNDSLVFKVFKRKYTTKTSEDSKTHLDLVKDLHTSIECHRFHSPHDIHIIECYLLLSDHHSLTFKRYERDLLNVYTKRPLKLSYKEIFLIIKDILNGLSFLETINLIHSDLKPENILRCSSSEVSIPLKCLCLRP